MGFSKAWFSIGELRSRISKDKRKYKFNKAFLCEKKKELQILLKSIMISTEIPIRQFEKIQFFHVTRCNKSFFISLGPAICL